MQPIAPNAARLGYETRCAPDVNNTGSLNFSMDALPAILTSATRTGPPPRLIVADLDEQALMRRLLTPTRSTE